ncbi:MAG: phosphopyruvate hydratase [Candidatus Thermoplasmatota archaeon]|nr:phosphopyruvate hydratase [Candidatus Thermoplasmatota archaeon]
MVELTKLFARTILDSRGNPTLEVDCFVEGIIVSRAAVPSGASTGAYEAIELRDGGNKWNGKGVEKAVKNVNEIISPKLIGLDISSPDSQELVDEILLELDGTENKSKLGANAMLGVSMSCLKASAALGEIDCWEHISYIMDTKPSIPVPMMNILNGGAHASSDVDIQEFMVIPHGFDNYKSALRAGTECYHSLKSELKKDGLLSGIGDEGGFAPNLPTNEHGLQYMVRAIEGAGYSTDEIGIALDVAATEFYTDGKYNFDQKKISGEELAGIYSGWADEYPLLSIEDPFDEDDWGSWNLLTKNIGKDCQIVGDDLYVTQVKRLQKGIDTSSSNSILVKLNQVGTVSETFETLKLAWDSKFSTIISHRSGETSDTIIADLAVGSNAGQIKTGAPARSDRTSKYNQLLRISENLHNYATPFKR